jgi:hypothetical protein
MEARTLSVLRRRVGAVKGVDNSEGRPVAGGRTTPSALPIAPPVYGDLSAPCLRLLVNYDFLRLSAGSSVGPQLRHLNKPADDEA